MRIADAHPVAETRRDPIAVEEAFATHYSAVFRQVQRLMRDPDDSYDLTLTAWEKAQRDRPVERPDRASHRLRKDTCQSRSSFLHYGVREPG